MNLADNAPHLRRQHDQFDPELRWSRRIPGDYDVVVTNPYSSVTSQVATLGVYLPVGISVPPQNTSVIVSSNAVFSVTASGSEPLSYQWQRSGTNLSERRAHQRRDEHRLTIAATRTNDAGGYAVVISNILGSVTSPSGNANRAARRPKSPARQMPAGSKGCSLVSRLPRRARLPLPLEPLVCRLA